MNLNHLIGARASCLTYVVAGTLLAGIPARQAEAGLIGILGPEDFAIAVDLDAVPVPPTDNGRYPANENTAKAIDGLSSSKYLNFGGAGSGFIVSPATAGAPVGGFRITTANDAPGRDPASYALYGFNGTLSTTDSGPSPAINQTGLAEAWTLISTGSITLPDERNVVGSMVAVDSTVAFEHYKIVFPTIKTQSLGIMQFAEIQFFTDATDLNSGFLAASDPIIAVDETPTPATWAGSSSPSAETPARGIDQLASTKYLNFGEERSGIIITNSAGPVKVDIMGLTTGNDAVERDPASYELYGTNDPITSEQNSNSNGAEAWTLISAGLLDLPGAIPSGGGDDFRLTETLIPIGASESYASYRLIFPTVKSASTANSMQIADIQFYTVPEPSAMLLALGAMALLTFRRRRL